MKVVLLGRADDVHVQRWVEALDARSVDLTVVSQHDPGGWVAPDGVVIRRLRFAGQVGYFANALALRRLLRQVRPDMLSAHFASGYGTTAALTGFQPTLLSVYGSDVYDFPSRSWFAGRLIRWNIRRAQRIGSTSHAMAAQVRRLVPDGPAIDITPFGVDTTVFRPPDVQAPGATLTIGTIKVLADKYGVDLLIRAFARLCADDTLSACDAERPFRLLLVGDGPDRAALERLAVELGVAERTRFIGRVPHADVPDWLRRFDIFVAASRRDSESFGVAVIEASSCGLPVVVSDVGGLPEVVRSEETGIVVPREDDEAVYLALRRLVLDDALRARMGAAGREFVCHEYEWSACIDRMLACYESVRSVVPAR